MLDGDPSTDFGHRLVHQLHDVEVVHHERGVWQGGAHGALSTLDMSIATSCTPARQSGSRAANQLTTVAVARPSTCPSSPCPPDRSQNPTCQRSTAVRHV